MALAPALCSAGLLHHDCESHEESCSHEADCETDPCDQPARVTNGWRPDSLLDAGLDCQFSAADVVPERELVRGLAVLYEALPPPIPVIHTSDLPLLL